MNLHVPSDSNDSDLRPSFWDCRLKDTSVMQQPSDADAEAAVRYDRQVRLWGSTTQRMLQSTRLFVGPGGVTSEAVKNLVLSGVGKVLLHDPQPTTVADINTCCLLRPEDVSGRVPLAVAAAGRLKVLNPLVDITVADTMCDFTERLRVARQDDEDALPYVLVGNALLAEVAALHDAASAKTNVINIFSHQSDGAFVTMTTTAADASVYFGDAAAENKSRVFVSRRSAATQLCLLQMAAATRLVSEDAPAPTFGELLQCCVDARDELAAVAVTDDALEEGLLHERQTLAGATPSVVQNAIVGGVVCQQVIGRIARAAAAVDAATGGKGVAVPAAGSAAAGTVFEWAYVTPDECVVGLISE
jgi:hypothetical protein